MKISFRHTFIIFFLIAFFPISVFAAISLDKQSYSVWDNIYFTSSGGPYEVYDVTAGINYGGDEEYSSDPESQYHWLSLDKIGEHQYSVVELTEASICERGNLSYSECKILPEFIGEFQFSVLRGQSTGGATLPISSQINELPFPSGGGGGPTSYRPEISIYSPLDNKVYGINIDVIYEVIDKNDTLGQDNLGLGDTPVTIFFSKTSDIRQRTQIGSGLTAKGVFKWNTKDLPEGDTYNIIIGAKDKVNETGESVSGNFSIDHTAPVFTLKTDPTVTRGEDVKIFVESSKALSEAPRIRVAQNEFNYFDVAMKGDGVKFEGIYKVVGGYDGPAKIEVLGKDLAGNESALVVSGGQFSVGILPPPKPIILSPLDRDIASAGIIEVKGKARKDTEVLLTLNGEEKFSKNPDENGEFVFANLKLRPDFNFGINIISIISKDAAGNISEPADLNLKYNIAPEMFIVTPVKGQVLGSSAQITVNASDKNKDKLKFKYEVSKDGGATWDTLPIAPEKRSYMWDTTIFSDGDYLLRVTVEDGTSEKTATVDGLVIKNLLPTFSFVDGIKTVTNKKEIVVNGSVMSSIKSTIRANILSVEYSLDNGSVWNNVVIESGINSPDVKFNIPLTLSEEKNYQLLLRAKDDREIYGRGSKTVVAIFEPPTIPSVTSFRDGVVLDDSFDANKLEAGIQISVGGNSKPNTTVNVSVDGIIFSGKSDTFGKFLVTDVAIRKHGNNTIFLYAEDEAGNRSGTNTLNLVYNNGPILSFLNPRQNRGLNHKTVIEFGVFDPDGDDIKRTILSLKKPGESAFKPLDINSPDNKVELDVSAFDEGGGYDLKLESSDGVSVSSKIVAFFVDNTAPKILLNAVPNKNFKKDFRFEATGYAEDGLSGIEFVEYSLDGEHWFKAVLTKGFLTKKANFNIRHPFTLDDGEYEIKFRSVDVSGNHSAIISEKIVVDTMPPRMGSFELSYSGISMYPDVDGFKIIAGENIKFRVSFESDTKEAYLVIGDNKILLNRVTGNVWEGNASFGDIGYFDIKFDAKDIFGNEVKSKNIGILNIVNKGRLNVLFGKGEIMNEPVEGATIEVLVFSEDRQTFERWPGEYYNIENPTKSNELGNYFLFLPAGKYHLNIQKSGFVKLDTNEFVIFSGQFLNSDFAMKRREGIRGFVEDMLDKIMIF